MRKLAPARVSYQDDFLILYRVYIMIESFHILLIEGTLHVDKIQVWFKIANITHALPIPVYRQIKPADRFHAETGARFKFTCYCREILYQSEILAPVQEPGWTHAGVTRASITFCGGIM